MTALTRISDDERLFFDTVYDFAKQRILPLVSQMDEQGSLDPSLLPALFELGVMGVEVPEQYGGSGSSFFNAILAVEALARIDPSVSVLVDVQNTLVINALLRWANEEQKQRYLPKMASEWVGSYALSEASSGSDAFALKLPRRKKGRPLRPERQKLWITNAAESSLFVGVRQRRSVAGLQRHYGLLGRAQLRWLWRRQARAQARHSRVEHLRADFRKRRGARRNVLGEVGRGYKIAIRGAQRRANWHRRSDAGVGSRCLRWRAAVHAGTRAIRQAHRRFQGMQFLYARVAMEIEASRLMVYNAARLKDAGQPFVKEAAMAKLFASEVAERTASQCVEFYGGVGFTKEYPAEKFYRDAKIGKIYEGTSNMQLVTIAKLL